MDKMALYISVGGELLKRRVAHLQAEREAKAALDGHEISPGDAMRLITTLELLARSWGDTLRPGGNDAAIDQYIAAAQHLDEAATALDFAISEDRAAESRRAA